jgi:hypothetical protein
MYGIGTPFRITQEYIDWYKVNANGGQVFKPGDVVWLGKETDTHCFFTAGAVTFGLEKPLVNTLLTKLD